MRTAENNGNHATHEQNARPSRKETVQHLNKRLRRKNWVIFITVIVALLLLGHVIWCLTHHIGDKAEAGHVCPVCMLPEDYCSCAEIQMLLRDENEELALRIAYLELQLQNATQHQDDGVCHSACSVHCPDCMHVNTHTVETTKTWNTVGNEGTCRKASWKIQEVCSDCGQVLNSEDKSEIDTEHNYGGDRTCDDCGYTKPSVTGGSSATAKPTSKPTSVPTQAPTLKPTAVPTQEPTPKPTNAPTAAPTACPHTNTYDEPGDWIWSNVGSFETCRMATRSVKVFCSACKKHLDTRTESQYDNEHNYGGDRVCDDCGYTKPCTHSNTRTETSEKTWTKVSTEGTCREAKWTVTVICNDCGATISSETKSETDHEHSFSGKTCSDCGYKRPVQSGSAEAEGTIPPNTNEWEEDDGEVANPVS